MMENIYIKEFREVELLQATEEFWKATEESIRGNIAEVMETIKKEFSQLFLEIAQMQEVTGKGIGKITISLLRVSAWEEKKRARIEVYDKNEIIGKLLYKKEMDISFLFVAWESYRLRLIELADKKGVRRYITDPVIRHMQEEKLKSMAEYFYGVLKYILLDADEIEHFQLLEKESGFAITVGEYQDWQKVLYIQMPPMDLNQPDPKYPMMFGHFEDQTYKRLHIKDLKLEKSKFVNCKFQSCIFENVNMNDVRFVNCIFQNTEMKSGTMYGAMMFNCIRVKSDFSGMQTKWVPTEADGMVCDIYQNAITIESEGTGI